YVNLTQLSLRVALTGYHLRAKINMDFVWDGCVGTITACNKLLRNTEQYHPTDTTQGGGRMNKTSRTNRREDVVSPELASSALGNQEAARMYIPSDLGGYLSASKPKMHSFEASWSNSCSSFKHCVMMSDKIVLSEHVLPFCV